MRIFTIALSIYIFVLSLVPCGDNNECNEKQTMSISTTSEHDNHKHDKESCTPFCICSCCGTSVINLNLVAPCSAIIPIPSKEFPLYKLALNSEIYSPIWQPPKIS